MTAGADFAAGTGSSAGGGERGGGGGGGNGDADADADMWLAPGLGGVSEAQEDGSPEEALQAAVIRVAEFHRAAEEMGCQLDLLLTYERFSDANGTMLYPVNVLRNYARLQARTEMVGLFDVDMLPSRSLFEELQDATAVSRLLRLLRSGNGPTLAELRPAALVLPAFISYDAGGHSAQKVADRMVNASKATVDALWRHGVVDRFDPKADGHMPTNYDRWFNATEPYEVLYAPRYEPWVVVDRLSAPWHDARFRGYGQNKIVHLQHMAGSGYRFVVHPSAWLIHRKHKLTTVKLQHLRDRNKMKDSAAAAAAAEAASEGRHSTVYGHSEGLGFEIRAAIQLGNYTPAVGVPTHMCARVLPWWQQFHWQWQAQVQAQRVATMKTFAAAQATPQPLQH